MLTEIDTIHAAVCSASKPPLRERPLLGQEEAGELAAVFKVLANDSRLRLLHALARADELHVTDLAAEVEMSPQAVSNQLQRLVDRRVLAARRRGSNVFYRILDPCLPSLLEVGLCLSEEARAPEAE
jgi:DNA-binding transcriptional ArsR family regulator